MALDEKFAAELHGQKGFRYRDRGQPDRRPAGWHSRRAIVRDYVDHVTSTGDKATHQGLIDILTAMDRDYSLTTAQISKSLASHRKTGKAQPYPNGYQLMIDAQLFRSARVAAEAIGVSPQTVLNRIASDDPKWARWRKA